MPAPSVGNDRSGDSEARGSEMAHEAREPHENAMSPKDSSLSRGLVLVLFAVILAGVLVRAYRITDPPLERHRVRQCDTAAMARNFHEGSLNILYPQIDWGGSSPGYVDSEFPIFPFAIALLYRAFGVHEWFGRAINIGAYVFSAIFLFRLTRRLFGDQVALVTVLFYSFVPLSVGFTRTIQPEPLMALGTIVGIYYFWVWCEDEWRPAIWLSALGIALAALLKPFSLYVGVPLFYLCYRRFGWKFFRKAELWVYFIAVMVPIALWYSHAWELWNDYGNTLGVFAGRQKLFSSEETHLGFWLSLGKRLFERLVYLITTPAGLILLLVGMLTKPPRREYLVYWWAVGFALCIAGVAVGHWMHDYYQLPVVFIASIFMAMGVVRLWELGWPSKRFAAACAVMLSLATVGYGAWRSISERSLDSSDWNRMSFARNIQELTESDAKIVFLSPEIDSAHKALNHRTPQGEYLNADPVDFYLAHRKGWSVGFPRATPRLVESLRQRGAKYLATFWPSMLPRAPGLMEELQQNAEVISATSFGVIYRLRDPSKNTDAPGPR
jgi:hypothetical protein